MTVLPTVLSKVVEAIQAWILRGSHRTVNFKGKVDRQEIEFEAFGEDLQKLVDQLSGGPKKR